MAVQQAHLARIPDSPFTTQSAVDLGFSHRDLTELVDSGELRRVLRGVYVRTSLSDTLQLRVAALALVVAAHVVICDRTAAWLWGVDVFRYHELEILPPVETCALRGRSRVRRTGCAGGERDLARRDVVRIGDVLVTTPMRTALDLACRLRSHDALAALDAFMRLHGLTTEQLRRELTRFFRRRGVVQARRLIPLADPKAESHGESWTRMEMKAHGLPTPQLQVWVYVDGVPTYRLDLAYPKHKVAVEYDGRAYHEGEQARDADRARRTWLRDHGWTVIVVTKDSFTSDEVDGWIGEVRDALRSRSAHH